MSADEKKDRIVEGLHPKAQLFKKLFHRNRTAGFQLKNAGVREPGSIYRFAPAVEQRLRTLLDPRRGDVLVSNPELPTTIFIIIVAVDNDAITLAAAVRLGTQEDLDSVHSDEEVIMGENSPYAMAWHTVTGSVKVFHWCTFQCTVDEFESGLSTQTHLLERGYRAASRRACCLSQEFTLAVPELSEELLGYRQEVIEAFRTELELIVHRNQ